ncbi:5-formyltetrahydrofolate cyclo-ligase [Vallitalea okinawensis]|uniref:5-formyltetrahydrofolate cyclo-ligase n=1 Tax=Vallitalea okinawensis TaxID=2078660 RepID=UPI000CFDC029|nr:5-formyltetrahydrofolate cyclo-ligase [Vallitalea okinawensis]
MDYDMLRSLSKKKRKDLHPMNREAFNELIFKKLLLLLEYREIDSLFSYVSLPEEVDTKPILNYAFQKGITVAVPRVIDKGIMSFFRINNFNDLEEGNFKVLEPVLGLEEIRPTNSSVIIVPGVAFDHNLSRIGYGGGYYDRYLGQFSTTKIALAYSCQLVDPIEIREHDVAMDYIITEEKIISK